MLALAAAQAPGAADREAGAEAGGAAPAEPGPVRACLLKEDFQLLWDCRSPTQANKFIKRWCRRPTRSRIKPMQKVARMLRKHRPLILNWFRTGGPSPPARWRA